ncbi:uncharacterized protein ATNIH1004_007455 [Aspergillus tanneri]|uniref:Uncharacterized protein n=1 Tax=Aspergillus tanneri TaxID=1220188 RepID=A0A5M9MM26_9EURO|nr:uncharacterized protein ATNIH1004_007455 [Aspergillus tanneri]KAA8646033.1 hypothetical protein ATNIH1004_007455 [Aspergillus tanneri]
MQNLPSKSTEVEATQVLAEFGNNTFPKHFHRASFSSLPEHLKNIRPATAAEVANTSNFWTLPSSDEPLHLGLFFEASMSLQKNEIPTTSLLSQSVRQKLDSDARKRIHDDIDKDGGPDELAIAKEIFPAVKSRFKGKLAENTINITAAVKVLDIVAYIIANKNKFK